jgi:cell wall-associated NlpC family hydrolase
MSLTVKGQPMSARQQHIASILIGAGQQLNAGSLATEAIIFDAIFESDIGEDNGWDASNETYGGPLGGSISYFGSYGSSSSDAVAQQMAQSFFQGGRGYQGGGAIALARTSSDVAYIGSQVTAAVPFNSQGYSTQYLSQDFPFSEAIAEARAIVAASGGATTKGGTAGGAAQPETTGPVAHPKAGGSGTVVDGSSTTTYAFSVGGTDNPDEDYWTAINRLAQEVNWYLFSNGEYLVYMDGQEMLAQKPAVTIDRIKDNARFYENQASFSFDNTSYTYVSQHLRRFRTQRQTHVSVSQSPTEATINLICGIEEILGGDVVELTNFGLGDGRWVVSEARRSVFDVYSELTLVPAIAPITEASAAGTTGSTSTSSTSGSIVTPGSSTSGASTTTPLSGSLRNKVVQAALQAVARQKASGAYDYPPQDELHARPYPSSLFGPAPVYIDCSSFAILCYKAAGAPDPNETSYDGTGYTGTLVARGTAVTRPQPGDLIFYETEGGGISHVNVYIGNAQCANMGTQGEPIVESLNAPGPILAMRAYL